MSQERSSRYAHSEGHTDLCFSDDGKFMITGGSEGDIRIWNGFDDDNPIEKFVGDKVNAVAQKGEKLYVGSNHDVKILTFPEAELDGILTKFTATVTTIAASKDGNYIACGSCDMDIRLIEIATSKVTYFSGHKAPILHVAIDPKNEYLASSSCDGTVNAWKIQDQSVLKTWSNIVTPSNSFDSAETVCHISWEPITGRLFAIPSGSEVKVYQRSTWNVMMTLSNNDANDKFGLTSWSSCGNYLAASTTKGKVVVWNTLINKMISSSSHKSEINVCALAWNPISGSGQLAICDLSGELTVITNCCPKPTTSSSKTEVSKTSVNSTTEFDDSDLENLDEDDPDAISLEKIKSEFNSFIEGGDDQLEKELDEDGASVKSFSTVAPKLPLVELQPPFQPTSTPIHLQRRFMVFNDVGYVRQTNTEEENMLDIDFHDISIHHAFRINNILGHVMAALSPEALVLACEKTEESSSKVVCRLLNSWDDTKEWNTSMPEEESIESVAVGSKWIAVVTNLWYLRIFSLSGVQREIINLPGPILSMSGLNNYLFIVYHNSVGLPDNQNLGFQILNITHNVTAITPLQPLPLSPKSTLKWIGFSDDLNPCALDSNGILKIFVYKLGTWRPICDVDDESKSSSNHHFVIGVSEERRNIRCILCRGSYYPATTPHPFITEIDWKIPVCESTIDKGIHEEKFWTAKLSKETLTQENDDLNKEILAKALKVFALSCITSHEMRAFEFCDFVNQPEFTELALKYASRGRNNLLVEKLLELRSEQLKKSEEESLNFESNFPGRPYEHRDSLASENGYGDPEPENYESQELFPDSKNTQESTNYSNESSVSLIVEMKKKKKSLSEQKNQVIPPRKINPFRKGLSKDVSVLETQSSAKPTKENQDVTTSKPSLQEESFSLDETDSVKAATKKSKALKSKAKGENEKINSPVNENQKDDNQDKSAISKKRKSDDDNEKSVEKRKAYFKLQGFAFKKSDN